MEATDSPSRLASEDAGAGISKKWKLRYWCSPTRGGLHLLSGSRGGPVWPPYSW